jgi:hypothetical protein
VPGCKQADDRNPSHIAQVNRDAGQLRTEIEARQTDTSQLRARLLARMKATT